METYGKWTKVFDHLKGGELEALLKVKNEADNSANNDVELKWELTYDKKHGQLMSLFNITPKTAGSYISCNSSGMMEGKTVLAAGLSSQLSGLKTEAKAGYSGWLWRHYEPGKPTTVNAEIMGTLTAPDGTTSQFDFKKSIKVD